MGYDVVAEDTRIGVRDDLAKVGNNVTNLDMYNLSWDPSIDDPADIRKKAEWAATFHNWNRKQNALEFSEQQGLFPILGFEWRF